MKKTTKFKDGFQRWAIINSSANYIADVLSKSNCTLNLEKILVSMMVGGVVKKIDDIDWLSKRQMDGLKRDVLKELKAIEERDIISFRLGNLKEINRIDYSRLET